MSTCHPVLVDDTPGAAVRVCSCDWRTTGRKPRNVQRRYERHLAKERRT